MIRLDCPAGCGPRNGYRAVPDTTTLFACKGCGHATTPGELNPPPGKKIRAVQGVLYVLDDDPCTARRSTLRGGDGPLSCVREKRHGGLIHHDATHGHWTDEEGVLNP
ncbi:hypothetical protein [Streptomyces sp. NPDC087300]|uniref:hypothetical protein n=1 Tax=Streptomyces sp. NPDC087300 TaxID=3365780 RepID=UPI0037FD6AB1